MLETNYSETVPKWEHDGKRGPVGLPGKKITVLKLTQVFKPAARAVIGAGGGEVV
jgi:hypothetical protein